MRWLVERHKEGRNVAVCLGFPQGGLFLSVDDLARHIPLAELEQKIETRKALAERLIGWLTGEHDELFRNTV